MFGKKDKKENINNVKSSSNAKGANDGATSGVGAANGKFLSGKVTSNKMKDTVVVEVQRYFRHPKYGKYINARKKYKVHDTGNSANIGDEVSIVETRPISKDKRFRLLEIVKRAPQAEVVDEAEDSSAESDVKQSQASTS